MVGIFTTVKNNKADYIYVYASTNVNLFQIQATEIKERKVFYELNFDHLFMDFTLLPEVVMQKIFGYSREI